MPPVENRVQEVLDFRRGGCGREQESEEKAHDQMPEFQAHVPVAGIGDDGDNEDERNRDCHERITSFR